jgi:CDP-paratose 2-epimerase
VTNDYLITGGAGFIGINLAAHALSQGRRVTLLDNFSRRGAEDHVRWLRGEFGDGRFTVLRADVRTDHRVLAEAVEQADVVFHLAAQVAVTTSVQDPRQDFEINALGTLNVLEAVRASHRRPIVVYSSTNKVYGKLANLEVGERGNRYEYVDLPTGVPESQLLDFYSPYGCSKGAGDQYVIDYSRIYGLRTVVFRQSCIYGPHQFGIEDQGWLAWFAIRALEEQPVTIYGDGKQVRDVLYVEDLIAAYEKAVERIEVASGQAYNIGGGPAFTLSLLELLTLLERRLGRPQHVKFADWRPGDQRVYVSDLSKLKRELGWAPLVDPAQGVGRLVGWLEENLPAARASRPAAAGRS